MSTLLKAAVRPGRGRAAAVPRPPRPPGAVRRTAVRIAVVLVALLVWQGAVETGTLPRTSVPTATSTVSALGTLVTTPAFWHALGQTAEGWAVGLLISAVVGVGAGLLLGSSRFLAGSTRLVIDFLRTIPAVALTPVLLLTLGSTMTMKLTLVVFGSVWPLLTSTMDGVRHVDPVAADTFRTFRLSARQRMARLVLPSALPFVATGLRTSAVVALMLTTAAEYLGAAPGVGKSMSTAEQAGAVDVMFGWLVVAGLLGVLLNSVFLAAERRTLRWAPAQREVAAR
jgi:ABC-type nitrate/sulfonate/bicarbonate transport system permease component